MVCRYADLAATIRRSPARCGPVRLVAVDGPGGAGKSVFAQRLTHWLGDGPVIHTDGFASWDNQFDWWTRLEEEVLVPLARGWPVRFRAYDWVLGQLGDWREVPRSDVVLLEGVSSARRAVADRLSSSIWIDAPAPTRLERGLDRDGHEKQAQWEQWMAQEEGHYTLDRTRDRADVIVDGDPSIPHDRETEFVCLHMSADFLDTVS